MKSVRQIFIATSTCVSLLMLLSCQSVDKEKVVETVNDFFNAYRSEDISSTLAVYPEMSSLRGNFRKSTSIDISKEDIIVVNDSNIIANITHHWVNPFGVDNSCKMKIFLKKQDDKYIIFDTKNFCLYENLKVYDFAKNVGAVNLSKDTTDLLIAQGLDAAQIMFWQAKQKVSNAINNGLCVSSMNWHTGYYSDYASGNAIVTNNSIYPIKRPTYRVDYRANKNASIITSDDGTVCYDILSPGQSKSFSWYTSYVGNAHWANVSVMCNDDDWVEDIVANLPYSGTEYTKFQNNGTWWSYQ